MEVGKLFTLSFYQSSPWLLACGGSGNQLALWDMTREEAIQKRFGDRLSERRTVDEEETFARKDHDFEAMMAAGDAAIDEARENAAANKKDNNKKGKKKKGARKRGR
jgi:periodic tryptophan protein 1